MSELVGRKLGKYTLESQLGEGGMAAVYRSHHPQFNRPVAIKILPPTIGQDPSFRARFEREGRTIAGLNHPSIIRVYDVDEADGLFYMVMDLLPGGTLEARLGEGALDRKWSTMVIVKMAEALEYAHSHGVIHRDIKPSNILLDAEGQPVLADFGIARLAQNENEANLTSAGMVMGTPAYMAPEQLNGGQPDARSDIYALGVVLYQILTGRAPFTGDTMAIVTAHLTRQPQALRELVQDLPEALDAVVLQALAKQPEHRFKSAGVFAQALRSAAADLEPGMVRVSSAAHTIAASFAAASPGWNETTGSPAAGSAIQASAALPQTSGQKVARYLPIVLGALGLLLLISVIAKYWALVILLAILFGGGGFLFLYLRASSQGRKAAQATTKAITIATASDPANSQGLATPLSPEHEFAPIATSPASQTLLPSSEPERQTSKPEEPLEPLPDLPTQAIGASSPNALPQTDEALAGSEGMQPTEAISATDSLPTEALLAATSDDMPVTEALPIAGEPPAAEDISTAASDDMPVTEALPIAGEPPAAAAAPDRGDLAPTEAIPSSAARPKQEGTN